MRTVIWIVVGVLVVAAVVFFVVARSQSASTKPRPLTADAVKATADRATKAADRLAANKAKLQDDLAHNGKLDDAARAKLDQMDAILNQMRDKIKALETATGNDVTNIGKDIVKLTRQFNDLKRSLQKGG